VCGLFVGDAQRLVMLWLVVVGFGVGVMMVVAASS
jgi:hypothetical protein